jgi:tetratricopeptide (TPR) repeat protein
MCVCDRDRLRRLGCGVLVAAILLAPVLRASARADALVKTEITTSTDNGFARLAFKFDEPMSADIRLAWPIMIVTFAKPLDVSVDKLSVEAKGYISAARRDPDGSAIRIALARKLRIHSIPAGKRFYLDLLPENWTGMLPGLPQDVIDELARKAGEADRLLRQLADKRADAKPIRVKVASQPTFTRYVFDLPADVHVNSARGDGTLTLEFDRPVTWDLADAVAALPPTLRSIRAEKTERSASVTFQLKGMPSVRTFEDGGRFVTDIGNGGVITPRRALEEGAAKLSGLAPAIAAPATVPAKDNAIKARIEADTAQPAIEATPAASQAAPKPLPSPPKVMAGDHKAKPVAPAAVPEKMLEHATPVPKPMPREKASARSKRQVAPIPPPDPKAPVIVGLNKNGDTIRLEFPFAVPTPAAVFSRTDVVWLVFDNPAQIAVGTLPADSGGAIRSATFERAADGAAVVRLRLQRPRLISVDGDGPAWTVTIADTVTIPSHPLGVARGMIGKGRAKIIIPFDHPGNLHHLIDPESGERLLVVTALAPVRGFLQPQNFVELQMLASRQGMAVRPIADDVAAELSSDKITFSRPGGLIMSGVPPAERQQAIDFRNTAFDTQLWAFDRKADYGKRQSELIRLAAAAPPAMRRQARFRLARFYLARHMPAEAKGVLDVATEGDEDDVTGSVLSAVANLMLDRPEQALVELDKPRVAGQLDAPVWRAIAYSRQGKWAEAHAAFAHVEIAVAALPIQLQRMAMLEALRSAVEVRDFHNAAQIANACDGIGMPGDLHPRFEVLIGRIDEGLGRTEDALSHYRAAATSKVRPAAAQGKLRQIELRLVTGATTSSEAIAALETLTTVWRGDETEAEGLRLLAHLYTKKGRYREAFHVMRVALLAHPNSDLTRRIHDEAEATFESLFLSSKGNVLPPIEALGLFYDYRELTPIGRRGDEMIRRLADRLVAVDLLDQAAQLLQHQVDHRLQGAARAQVATRLATIYLMNHKPDRALATLQSTRTAQLNNELRDQRLLVESRALSEIGRYDVALELIEHIKSHEAQRLRADILWAAKRWRAAAEQIELMYGDRWRQFAPLDAGERFDVLRAAIGYALADERLSLGRFREKYAAKMEHGPEGHAFDVVSAPIGTDNAEFRTVARRLASIGTLSAFLRDMRKRYPESAPLRPDDASAKAALPMGKPKPSSAQKGAPKAGPAAMQATADVPTGSIARR